MGICHRVESMLTYIPEQEKRVETIKDISNSIMYVTSGRSPTKNQYYNGIQMLWVTRFGVIDSRNES